MTDSDPAIAKNFSLVVGGPFYRALVRVHLVEPAPNIRGRIPVLILLTWMPLLVLSLARGTALGNSFQIPLLRDFSIWARFLLGLPLLIIAEVVIDPWIRRVVSIFESSGIIQDADRPAFHAALEKTKRLRDSGLAELILMILAGLPVFLFFDSEWVSEGISSWHGSAYAGFSPAGWWFAFISSPMIRFLLFRWLWRYGLWSALLYKIVQLNLDLRPSHPDLLGGLGFVLNAQRHFGILFAAIGTVIAGQYANSITYFGTSLKNIQVPVLA